MKRIFVLNGFIFNRIFLISCLRAKKIIERCRHFEYVNYAVIEVIFH